MKRKIKRGLLEIATLAMVTTLLLTVAICYRILGNQVIEDLRIQARIISRLTGGSLPEALGAEGETAEAEGLRITVITASGEVRYDTGGDGELMENHRDRPEIRAALAQGEGWASRRSATRGVNTFYYALKLADGTVLRVSQEAGNMTHVFITALPIVLLVMAVMFGLSVLIAHIMTESLVRPIRDMVLKMEKQEIRNTYEELQPLIDTIQKQNASLLDTVKIRQEFTANVSHELKTPLTAISGYAELLENGMVEDETDITRFAGEIHKNANRLLTLINDIIRLSELDAWESGGADREREAASDSLEQVNLYEIAESCVHVLQINAEKHHVSIEMTGEPAFVSSTRQMMEELVFNLCDNAIRYNRENGRVEVSVWTRRNRVILAVKDNGIGISGEHQDRIFERFYRVDKGRSKSTGGTGLGLAIVKHIITRHDAKVELESEAGRGTSIKIIFQVP